MKQIRLKNETLKIDCCEIRQDLLGKFPCPCKNNDAHGDGDDGCNLGADLWKWKPDGPVPIPDDCPLEEATD